MCVTSEGSIPDDTVTTTIPNLGPVHFQYYLPESTETNHKATKLVTQIPTEILGRLFQRRLLKLTIEQGEVILLKYLDGDSFLRSC
ncbi:hypothetical protein HFX_1865 [Haloferax mediterranei ATCC 33500]|nr:hypothetical protein HFX_1865 [Haloferax mediterranei ATCC 33500]